MAVSNLCDRFEEFCHKTGYIQFCELEIFAMEAAEK